MVVARDPSGFRPLCYAVQGNVFAAASESVALANAGFSDIKSLEPGTMILIDRGQMRLERFAKACQPAHCFFEWVYFANAGSSIDSAGIYVARANLGRALAKIETEPIDPADCVVVPVPDTAKAAAEDKESVDAKGRQVQELEAQLRRCRGNLAELEQGYRQLKAKIAAAEAAKNTSEMIEGTVKKIGEGSEVATATNNSFGNVNESSSKVGELVSEIASATNEQSQGVHQINNAVSEMDRVVQQNAVKAEEFSSASGELNAQAEQMTMMVTELAAMINRGKS